MCYNVQNRGVQLALMSAHAHERSQSNRSRSQRAVYAHAHAHAHMSAHERERFYFKSNLFKILSVRNLLLFACIQKRI